MSGVTVVCRDWVGSDTKGHICGQPVADGIKRCAKHQAAEIARVTKALQADRDRAARANAAWRERNARKVPGWRSQLERAEAEYARRTQSVIADRAAVGGSMHPSIVRAQRSALSDSNVARVVELERIIKRLKGDLDRMKGAQS